MTHSPVAVRFVACLLAVGGPLFAAEPRDARPVAGMIDREIDARLQRENQQPAPAAEDAVFLRRAYLDITGRIPTVRQATAFLEDARPDRRARLIDELLALPQYGEQFGRLWRDWIAPPELPSEGNGGNQPIQATQNLGKWLANRFNEGDGWDTLVRKILTAEGSLKEQPQGIFFSLAGDDQGKPQPAGASRTVSSLFMGVQLQCAECHNDPFKKWKQADFWGTAAFFRNMTWRFNGRYFDSIAEFDSTPVTLFAKFKKPAFINDKAPNGKITIPKEAFKNSGTVHPAKFIGAETVTAADNQPLRPVLAAWLTDRKNPYFARAFVNRTWSYFFSRGLVFPVDDMREDNPPSHPVLMEQLAAEFVASGHDVRHLVRCITNTRAYQRSSKPAPGAVTTTATGFGRMPVRVMSADVLYDSLRLAMTDPGLDLRNYDAKEAARFGESSPIGSPAEEFAKLFATNEDDPTDFTHGIPQFLALINHPRLRTGGKTVDDLLKSKRTPEQMVETLYLGTLSRRPTSEEQREAVQFVSAGKDPRRAYAGLLWTLVNRSEFLLVR